MARIINDFDMDALRRKRAARSAQGGQSLVESLKQIAPEIEKLKAGQTAELEIPEGQGLRKFVMSITAKLNNLTPKGGDWAGRQYHVASDGDKLVYVQRGEDLPAKDIPVRQRRQAGTAAKGATTIATSGAKVTENA